MRVRYSFSSRRTRHLENIRKQKPKFPRIVERVIEDSDILLEVLDSRFVKDTRNEEIEKFIEEKGKKIIYVLNKSDLVKKIESIITNGLKNYVVVSCKLRKGIKKLRDEIKIQARKMKKQDRVVVGVIGYPNTGKSSVINLLIGKSSAKTGAEAGFTKGFQKLKLTPDILLIDSPGVIPEKEYSSVEQKAINKHVKIGAKTRNIKDPEIVFSNLMKEYSGIFENFYKIDTKGNPEEFLEVFGRKKNFLKKGNEINFDKAARFILMDWQKGKITI